MDNSQITLSYFNLLKRLGVSRVKAFDLQHLSTDLEMLEISFFKKQRRKSMSLVYEVENGKLPASMWALTILLKYFQTHHTNPISMNCI